MADLDKTDAPKHQANLLALLNEWIETDPVEADPDYEAQKDELEKNRVSFGVHGSHIVSKTNKAIKELKRLTQDVPATPQDEVSVGSV